VKEWAQKIAEYHQRRKRTPEEIVLKNSVNHCKWTCVDDARTICPLIIEGVCIEDITLDTGSMFNAISLNGLYAMVGRFPSWEKAWETAINWCLGEKYIQAAGGQLIPVLAVIRLNVQVAGRKALPIHWAVYQDTEPSMILGTRGMKALKIEMKSPHLGGINMLVQKEQLSELSTKIYNAAITTPKTGKAPKTPEDVNMLSDADKDSLCSPMEVQYPDESTNSAKQFLKLAKKSETEDLSLFEKDMKMLGLQAKEISKEVTVTQSGDSTREDQVFREWREPPRSPQYDE
jgi:hypothetical protein